MRGVQTYSDRQRAKKGLGHRHLRHIFADDRGRAFTPHTVSEVTNVHIPGRANNNRPGDIELRMIR